MDFLESPRFPGCKAYGFSSDPQFDVTVIATASGREVRNRNWARPLSIFNCTVGPRSEAEIQECRDFYMVVGGTATGFRFKDDSDYLSCRVGETPSAADGGFLIASLDSPSAYQLTKRYTVGGALTQDREIYKPVQGTIVVTANGTPLTEGGDYTLDYTLGLVQFSGSPSAPLKWHGAFDIPARFDSGFPVEILNRRIESVSFVVRELRREDFA